MVEAIVVLYIIYGRRLFCAKSSVPTEGYIFSVHSSSSSSLVVFDPNVDNRLQSTFLQSADNEKYNIVIYGILLEDRQELRLPLAC